MNVARINKPFRGTGWRQQFADSLIALCPDLNPDAIDEMADAQYATVADTDPATAARLHALARGLIAPGASDAVNNEAAAEPNSTPTPRRA